GLTISGEGRLLRLIGDALLFDLDGVLVDSARVVEDTWRAWGARHGMDAERIVRIAHGRRAIDTLRTIAPHLDLDAEHQWLVDREATAVDGLRRIAGAAELLSTLPRDRWAIVTSGVRAVAEHR